MPHGHDPLTFGYWHKTRVLPALFMAQHASLGVYGLMLMAPLYLLFRNKAVLLDPRMKLSLLVVGLFILVIPCSIGDAVDIDSRLLVALA